MKGKADRNEALDLLVYNLGMAHYLGLHRCQRRPNGRSYGRLYLRAVCLPIGLPPLLRHLLRMMSELLLQLRQFQHPTQHHKPPRRSSSGYLNRR